MEACALLPIRHNLSVGIEWDRMAGTSSFSVHEATGLGFSADYLTSVDATSNAWLAVVRWERAEMRGPLRPFVQLGAGYGSASLEFFSPAADAKGDGRGVAASTLVGARLGHGSLQLEASAGYRFHPVRLHYRDVRGGGGYPSFQRFFFESSDEVRAFVDGRDVDLGGPFLRLGIAFSPPPSGGSTP